MPRHAHPHNHAAPHAFSSSCLGVRWAPEAVACTNSPSLIDSKWKSLQIYPGGERPQGVLALLLQEIFHLKHKTRSWGDGSVQVRCFLCKQEDLGLDLCDPSVDSRGAGVGEAEAGGSRAHWPARLKQQILVLERHPASIDRYTDKQTDNGWIDR